MSLPQETLTGNKPDHSAPTIRPSAAYGYPFSRMDYWWSSMPIQSRMGLLVAAGIAFDRIEAMAQWTWLQLGDCQTEIIRELGSQAMVAGFIREATDEFRRLLPGGLS